jgi:hypothetical protein
VHQLLDLCGALRKGTEHFREHGTRQHAVRIEDSEMMRFSSRASFALCICFILCAMNGCATTGGSVELGTTLPDSGITGGWQADGPVKLFAVDTIFNHINGEAELFFPYGFRGAAYGSYVSVQFPDASIEADVYEMGSPLDAFGIYSNFRYPEADFLELGCEGFVSDQQLMFYSDVYFVKLTLVGSISNPRESLQSCANAIRSRLPKSAACPPELDLVAVDGLIAGTEQYIADSVLGYNFFPKGFVVRAGTEAASVRAFVVIFDDDAEATIASSTYHIFLESSGADVNAELVGALPCHVSTDPLYKGVAFAQTGKYVYGLVGIPDTADIPPVFQALSRRLKSAVK